MSIAMQNPRFRRSRQKHGGRRGVAGQGEARKGGKGRGSGGSRTYRVRPGLGATSEVKKIFFSLSLSCVSDHLSLSLRPWLLLAGTAP